MNARYIAPKRPVRLTLALLACTLTLVLGACGRVNLEDLTPEAVRTQEAMVTPTAEVPTPAAGETPAAGTGAPVDLLAGRSLYNNSCAGCHDNSRAGALPLIGREGLEPTPVLEMLRSGTLAAGGTHNAYTETQLSDQAVNDILAFIAQ